MSCPFYNECKLLKNSGICDSSGKLLLCAEHNRLKKTHSIKKRAEHILKKGIKIRFIG